MAFGHRLLFPFLPLLLKNPDFPRSSSSEVQHCVIGILAKRLDFYRPWSGFSLIEYFPFGLDEGGRQLGYRRPRREGRVGP